MKSNASFARMVLRGQAAAIRVHAGRVQADPEPPAWVLPGSFNPLHDGHRLMAAWGNRHRAAAVEFEMSIDNVDKPALSEAEIAERLAQFSDDQPVWITRAASFVHKAQLFPGATFLVGVDTMRRIVDPKYYPDGESGVQQAAERFRRAGCRFLVFGRRDDDGFQTLEQIELRDSLAMISEAVPENDFRVDVSSSQLRAKSDDRLSQDPPSGEQAEG